MTGPLKPERSARSALPGTGKPHECPTCGRRHVDRRSLKQHVAAAHPPPADEMRVVVLENGEPVSDRGSNGLRAVMASNIEIRGTQ